jgi:KinB signaling pathway activation protein
MTLKKWFRLFWTTLVIGTVITLIIGLIMQLNNQEYEFPILSAEGGVTILTMTFAGATIAVLSQMGFFAYLIIKWIAISMFRGKAVWDILQLLLVAVAVGDLAYLRYVYFGQDEAFAPFMILPLIILVVGIIVAYLKSKMTSWSAFIPTLFIMTALTILEAVPALRLDNPLSSIFTLVPLMACNAWQVLILHKILGSKNSI